MVPGGGAWSRGVPGPRGGACSWGCLLWGYPFLGVCLLPGVPAQGWCLVPEGGVCSWGVPAPRGVSDPGQCAWWRPPTATAAGGTYPTGMHSCLECFRT